MGTAREVVLNECILVVVWTSASGQSRRVGVCCHQYILSYTSNTTSIALNAVLPAHTVIGTSHSTVSTRTSRHASSSSPLASSSSSSSSPSWYSRSPEPRKDDTKNCVHVDDRTAGPSFLGRSFGAIHGYALYGVPHSPAGPSCPICFSRTPSPLICDVSAATATNNDNRTRQSRPPAKADVL